MYFLCVLRPESCNAVGAWVQSGEGVLGGVAGLNFVVNWLSWCDGSQSPCSHHLSCRKDLV